MEETNLPDCENILIRLALRNGTSLRGARGVVPLTDQLPLLHVPAEDIFTRANNCPSGAGMACSVWILGPNRIRRGGSNETKGVRMLEFPADQVRPI